MTTPTHSDTPPADEFGYLSAWLKTARELGQGDSLLAERMATRLMVIADADDLPVAGPGPVLPHPGSIEASTMIDTVLVEFNYPTNTKNAARAGYVAASRLMPTPTAPDLSHLQPATQETIRGWLADGTFVERAIGVIHEQETKLMKLETAPVLSEGQISEMMKASFEFPPSINEQRGFNLGVSATLSAVRSHAINREHKDDVGPIAMRLRHVARLAGCPEGVPKDDETAVGAIFSVLGNIRRALDQKNLPLSNQG